MQKRGIEERSEIERTYLSLERNALSEERTMLAYIRTYLALLGVVYLGLRFYFADSGWSIPLALGISLFFGLLIVMETIKIKRLRVKRRKLQHKHRGF